MPTTVWGFFRSIAERLWNFNRIPLSNICMPKIWMGRSIYMHVSAELSGQDGSETLFTIWGKKKQQNNTITTQQILESSSQTSDLQIKLIESTDLAGSFC